MEHAGRYRSGGPWLTGGSVGPDEARGPDGPADNRWLQTATIAPFRFTIKTIVITFESKCLYFFCFFFDGVQIIWYFSGVVRVAGMDSLFLWFWLRFPAASFVFIELIL